MDVLILGKMNNLILAKGVKVYTHGEVSFYHSNPLSPFENISDRLRLYLGNFGLNDIIQNSAIAIFRATDNIPLDGSVESSKTAQFHGHCCLSGINAFDLFLWFAKDNSVCFEVLYCEYSDNINYAYQRIKAEELCYNSKGTREDTLYKKSDLEFCEKIRTKFIEIIGRSYKPDSNITSAIDFIDKYGDKLGFRLEDYNSFNRIKRAFECIKSARSLYFLPSKIAMYMACFEALFATETEEATHKVCERVACYVTKNRKKRVDIYDTIKSAYHIRSRYVHGDKLHKKPAIISDIEKLSVEIDSVARKIMTRIILIDSEIFLQEDDRLRLYMKRLVFI